MTIDPAFTPTPLNGFDRTSRLPATSAPHTGLSLDPALACSGKVLWDLTHGVYSNYQPFGAFSSLVTLLNGAGFSVYTTSAGVNNADLSAYNVLVVNVASNWNSAYNHCRGGCD